MIRYLKKVGKAKYEIPLGTFPDMKVPGILFISEEILKNAFEEQAIKQVVNASTLPGIVKASIAMPDIHYGYGLPIGGVVATRWDKGVVSPGGVGYDINCGVRLLKTNLKEKEIRPKLKTLLYEIFRNVPCGVGSESKLKLSYNELDELMVKGSEWAVNKGFGKSEDILKTESNGKLPWADPDKVSERARERGKRQIGTLGSGNHFLEIQVVDEIYDKKTAEIIGLKESMVTIMIHTGSRGFGHQIASDYLEVMEKAIKKYRIKLPDKELACAPINSKEGKDYLGAMAAAANFAWANRQMIMHWTRESFKRAISISEGELGLELIYDHAHNIVKKEKHIVDGKELWLAVHRKGATRAFPKNHPEIPDIYKSIGQPVLIPGDMGRYSYVLVGLESSIKESFGSSCHGAGRVLSRHKAIKQARGRKIDKELERDGILIMAANRRTIAEEMPEAYKDVSLVVDAIEKAGISKKVARMKPIGVIKG